jgi:voltage-gated potassium channel
LLAALLIFLVAVPLADEAAPDSPAAGALTFSLLAIIGIASLRGGGRLYWLGLFFVVAVVAMNATALVRPRPVHAYGTFAAVFGFLLVSILFTLGKVARETDISVNRVIGAVCIYLMLGVIWAVSYTTVAMFDPQAFVGIPAPDGHGWDSGWLYFSFTTMTTLGYGDVVPVSAVARTLAYLQAIFGQFYIVILVAGLVSAYITARGNEHR